jgi:hypothetical protein
VLSYAFLILIAMHLGQHDVARARLDAALRIDPIALTARRCYITSLMSRWGGSPDQMQAFMRESRHAGLSHRALAVLQQLVDIERLSPGRPPDGGAGG